MVEEKIEKSTKISIKDAYVKLLAVKLETLMARRHLEKDNEPVQVTENLFIGKQKLILKRVNWCCYASEESLKKQNHSCNMLSG